jgi:hypothetical protein
MDSKILTMFEIEFDDIDQKLKITVIYSNNDQLFDNNFDNNLDNNLQIFD